MKIRVLSGGFANQMRHYLFVRFANRIGLILEWWFDDSVFHAHSHVFESVAGRLVLIQRTAFG